MVYIVCAMAYEMTKRYIAMVLILIVSLAVMAMLVLVLGGRGSDNKSRSNGTTLPVERTPLVRQRRSPPPSIPPSEPSIVDDDDDTLYDAEDFISDYKITRLSRPNSKYFNLAYDINGDVDDDEVVSARSI